MAFVDTELRPAGEVQQKVGRPRLSEAIRMGAKLRPQCFNSFWMDGGSCAMGAAYEAVGVPYGADVGDSGAKHFTYFWGRGAVADIFHRNDGLHQSREEIAD